MNNLAELATLLASFVGSAFALVRFALNQSRATSERFVTYLEGSLERQEKINADFRNTLDQLTSNVRENSALLNRMADRIGVHQDASPTT